MVKLQALRDSPDAVRERGQAILDHLAALCLESGYTLEVDAEVDGIGTVDLGGYVVRVELTEELDREGAPADGYLSEVKYDWQRVRSTVVDRPSGRLHLRLNGPYSSMSWADRSRWSLDDKVPEILRDIRNQAARAAEERAAEEADYQDSVNQWRTAVVAAEQAHRADHVAEEARSQAERWHEASRLRSYAHALIEHPELGPQREVQQWAAQIRSQADVLDPLNGHADTLVPELSGGIEPELLDPYMPKGMSAARPPDRPVRRFRYR